MTLADRKAYQEAIQCLMQKPSRNKGIDGAPYVHNSGTSATL
jgi:hypothetical protein